MEPQHPIPVEQIIPDGCDPATRRAIERGAQKVSERLTAQIEAAYAEHGDALRAAVEVADAEVQMLARRGDPEHVQEFTRYLTAYLAAPIVGAALLAEDLPDTPADLT